MAKSVIINGVVYADVPEVDIPISGGGTAKFVDTDDGTATAADMLAGTSAYTGGVKIVGNIPTKDAAAYTPGTSDQTIASGQYLGGAQTIRGDQNLQPGNILMGCSIFGVTGTLALPTISQDSTTKVLSIA